MHRFVIKYHKMSVSVIMPEINKPRNLKRLIRDRHEFDDASRNTKTKTNKSEMARFFEGIFYCETIEESDLDLYIGSKITLARDCDTYKAGHQFEMCTISQQGSVMTDVIIYFYSEDSTSSDDLDKCHFEMCITIPKKLDCTQIKIEVNPKN